MDRPDPSQRIASPSWCRGLEQRTSSGCLAAVLSAVAGGRSRLGFSAQAMILAPATAKAVNAPSSDLWCGFNAAVYRYSRSGGSTACPARGRNVFRPNPNKVFEHLDFSNLFGAQLVSIIPLRFVPNPGKMPLPSVDLGNPIQCCRDASLIARNLLLSLFNSTLAKAGLPLRIR